MTSRLFENRDVDTTNQNRMHSDRADCTNKAMLAYMSVHKKAL